MKDTLKKILAFANLEIRRVDPEIRRYSENQNKSRFSGEIIEFLAPSCAGKSYIMQALCEHLGAEWVNSKYLPERLYEDPFELVGIELNDFYNKILFLKFENFMISQMTQLKFNDKIIALQFHLKSLQINCSLDAGLSLGVVCDEGLSSCFWRELIVLSKNDERLIEIVFRRRHVVFLKVPEEIFMNRIRKRQKENPNYHSNYPIYSEFELKNHIHETYKKMDELSKILGSSVITIHDDGLEHVDVQCKKIQNFVERRVAQRM